MALIIATIRLKETNLSLGKPKSVQKAETPETSSEKKVVFKITSLMVFCFIYEFCVRFAQAGYNSRYSIYIANKFNINSVTLSFSFLSGVS